MPIREVQGVPIVAWEQPDAIHAAPAELRGFFDASESVDRLLLDLSACPDLNAGSMEALTEAFRICADRKARVGMFGLTFETLQLIEILGLQQDLPPHMGVNEAEALATITSNGAAPPPPALDFDVPPATGMADVELEFDLDTPPATKTEPVELEFDIDDVGTAPTARFDPAAIAQATAAPPTSVGLTAVLWSDLAAQGYVIGGAGADEIMAAAAAPTATPPAAAAGPAPGPAGTTAPAPAAPAGEIDLGDLEDTGWSAAPAAPAGGIDFGTAPPGIDFGAPPADPGAFGAPQPAAGTFGTPQPAATAPAPFGAPAAGVPFGGAAMVSSGLFGASQAETPVAAQAAPPPAGPPPAGPPPAGPPPAGPPPAGPPPGYVEDDDDLDDSNETIMFAPGALDQALAAAAAAAEAANQTAPDPSPAAPVEPTPVAAAPVEAAPVEAAPVEPTPVAAAPVEPAPVAAAPVEPTPVAAAPVEPAPVAAAPVEPAPESAPAAAATASEGFYSSDNETVMIQPGMLDAALLAEVARAAGAETVIEEPPVEAPQAVAPAPAKVAPTGDEVAIRLFVLDQGIKTDLHVEVLGRMLKFERVIGPADLKLEGDVRFVLDQFAQSRLLRRQRSPRVRGGSGFVLAASPAARGTVTRLWRMWADPQGRTKINAWINEG